MQPFFYDSLNLFYKNPFGAVKSEDNVHFKIVVPRFFMCSKAELIIKPNSSNIEKYNMFWCGMYDEHNECWEVDFTPNNVDVYWYHFSLETNGGKIYLSKENGSHGVFSRDINNYQLTVYEKDFKTPEWLKGGIIYQIFPDRFKKSKQTKKNIPDGRKLHKNWDEIPDYKFNAEGKITNSDFFAGDIQGIIENLKYLKELNVTCIYLNPIFLSHSNHRYDTADYNEIDPLLGTNKDFEELCKKAKKLGIQIILDGVFSHTGSDSIYFNKEKRYKTLGAYNGVESPYYKWYTFSDWPDKYDSWWGFITLPEVNETSPEFNEFINGEKGIAKKWLKLGSSGWRLDVADELPDEFLENFRKAVKTQNSENLIIGEVWEDASNKLSYGHVRKFLLGNQLDSVMNYPFKNAILSFLTTKNAENFNYIIMSILENYPKEVISVLMNHIGTHDTERAITVLAGEPIGISDRDWQAEQKLSEEQYKKGVKLLKLASFLQYFLPGIPSIYYGDEAGLEGYKDPFNRRTYPCGKEDKNLIEWYKILGKTRTSLKFLKTAEYIPYHFNKGIVSFIREDKKSGEAVFCAVNCLDEEYKIDLPDDFEKSIKLWNNEITKENIILNPYECVILKKIINL